MKRIYFRQKWVWLFKYHFKKDPSHLEFSIFELSFDRDYKGSLSVELEIIGLELRINLKK